MPPLYPKEDPEGMDPVTLQISAIVAGCLMLVAGVAKKRLAWRAPRCRVCGNPKDACTCRWL
jgi:hypothetical protein